MEDFKIEPYDELVDYKQRHIDWVNENPSFKPKLPYPDEYKSYKSYLESLYRETIKQNYTAYCFVIDDGKYQKQMKTKSATKIVDKMLGLEPNSDSEAWFVTLNFSNDKWNAAQVLKLLQKFIAKPYVTELYGVFEYHSKECHPHFMMRLVLTKYNQKSKIVEKFWETALHNFMSDKQKIDVKKYNPEFHQPYLALDKAVEKRQNLDMDILWRKNNNLPEFLEKKI